MKKIKYRNNNYNNQVYSINYKFDSISPAGKCNGTALDLIKRYNELAKEAQGNGNYVEAEVFRQYAEHYRKIVTEINERKNSRFNNQDNEPQGTEPAQAESAQAESAAEQPAPEMPQPQPAAQEETQEKTLVETKPKATRKSFKVIEIADKKAPAARTKKVKQASVQN